MWSITQWLVICHIALTHWTLEVFAIFRKKLLLPSFLTCSDTSSSCLFAIFSPWFLTAVWICRYFSVSFNMLWNSIDELFLSWLAYEKLLKILSNMRLSSSLIACCFYCFRVNIVSDLRLPVVAKKRSRLVPLNPIPTDDLALLVNAPMKTPSLPPFVQCAGNWIKSFHFFANHW